MRKHTKRFLRTKRWLERYEDNWTWLIDSCDPVNQTLWLAEAS